MDKRTGTARGRCPGLENIFTKTAPKEVMPKRFSPCWPRPFLHFSPERNAPTMGGWGGGSARYPALFQSVMAAKLRVSCQYVYLWVGTSSASTDRNTHVSHFSYSWPRKSVVFSKHGTIRVATLSIISYIAYAPWGFMM